jgi:hypothetical protein
MTILRGRRARAAVVVCAMAVLSWGCGSDGLNQAQSGNFRPPDTQLAVGHTHIVEAVNLKLRIWPRNGQPPLDRSVFDITDPGCNTPGGVVSDPRVLYDLQSSRFMFVMLHAPGVGLPGAWCFSVSATSDALGTWYRYRIPFPNAPTGPSSYAVAFPDYPGLASGDDKVILTGNPAQQTSNNPPQAVLLPARYSTVAAINKGQALAGVPLSVNTFTAPYDATHAFLLQPVSVLDATSTGNMFAFGLNAFAADPAILKRIRVSGIPPSTTINIADIDFSSLGHWFSPSHARQPDSATNGYLDAGDGRVLNGVFRNGKVTLTASVACHNQNDVCVRMVRLDGTTITALYNYGETGKDYFYPAVTVDSALNQIVVFNRSSDTDYASVYVSGRRPTDPPNTLRFPPTLLKAGVASYWDGFCIRPCTVFTNRWGDYSAISVDAANQLDTRVAAEYPLGPNSWATWTHWLDHTKYPN